MIKSGELVVVVENVEQALRFYTDRLAFDLIDLDLKFSEYGKPCVTLARLKKGKCFITFKIPGVEDLTEFSFIKRCSGRSLALMIEIRSGIDKYFSRCLKREVKVVGELLQDGGIVSFVVRDPFGLKLTFFGYFDDVVKSSPQEQIFLGKKYGKKELTLSISQENELCDSLVDQIKRFGLLKRTAKKFVKRKLEEMREALS